MYGIIHKKIFDSTIIAEGHEVAYVFMAMITLSDEEDICDMSLPALALRINMPLAKVEHSVNRLGLPDEDSKSQTFNGRRVVPLKEIDEIESNRGWFMVNRESYISEAKKENRKKTNARHYMRTKSENVLIKTENVLKTPDSDHVKTHIDIDIDIDKTNKRKTLIPKDFCLTDQMIEYAKSKDITDINYLEDFTENFIQSCNAKGYKYVDFYNAWQVWFRKEIKKTPKTIEVVCQ